MLNTARDRGRQGFTLLELLIGFTIIALLIGGIMVGTELLRSAELNRVLAERRNWDTAVGMFRQTYNGWPGDMKDAEDIWGTPGAGCPPSAPITDGTTCNGDGDGIVEQSSGLGNPEWVHFWQHLGNAELIKGTYDAYYNTNSASTFAPSAFRAAVWIIDSSRDGTGWIFDGYVFAGSYINAYGLTDTSGSNMLMTPMEVMSLDLKIDDGKPATGEVTLMYSGGPSYSITTCATGAGYTDLNAQYKTSETQPRCSIVFRQKRG
jgi:prepilin-type N-terminal cleavage/methylation domain-containing protein